MAIAQDWRLVLETLPRHLGWQFSPDDQLGNAGHPAPVSAAAFTLDRG
jgi:hypothetical protein